MAGREGEVAEGGHDLGGGLFVKLGAIFIVSAVAGIVDTVFNGPVGAEGRSEREFAEGVGGATGDGEDGLLLEGAVDQLAAAVDASDLCDMGEGQLSGTHVAGVNGAGLDATMAFFALGASRGKKPAPGRAGHSVRAVRADCL